jgi:AAA15 family ATPase/GTPase
MLNSLYIKNYRNLAELRINSAGRVNLITGKNNTGKSTILEAIALYITKSDLKLIYQLLDERGENYKLFPNNKNATEINIKALSSLFTNRSINFDKKKAILIGGVIGKTLFGEDDFYEDSIGIRFVNYFDKVVEIPEEVTVNMRIKTERIIVENIPDELLADYRIGLEIRVGNRSSILTLEEDRPYKFGIRGNGKTENFQFIRTRNIEKENNGLLWDNITLTDKEQFVIEALKIIEPNVERIAFIEESPRERTAVIKLSNSNNILPLKSMGDGINRILTIILALVNSDNGFLLIDEFENGLHHSVQEKLWQIIFNLSEKLNVQIFATTHSEECISAFEYVMNNSSKSFDGKLIRLENNDGIIKQSEFNKDELRIANENDIDLR